MALMPGCQGCLPFAVDLPALKAFPAVLMLGGMSLGMLIGEVLCLLDSGRMESCHFGVVCILYGTGGADMGRTTVGLYRAFSVSGKATCSLLAWGGVKGDKWLDWECRLPWGPARFGGVKVGG